MLFVTLLLWRMPGNVGSTPLRKHGNWGLLYLTECVNKEHIHVTRNYTY